MVFDIFTLVEGFWILIPAYAANGFAPLAKYKKHSHPIDFGRSFRGRRVFGDGKTWEGLFLGIVVAILLSLLLQAVHPHLPWSLSQEVHGVSLMIATMGPLLGLLLGLGAMVGDLAGSFIKRRMGWPRGAMAPILDQDDFVVGALAFASILVIVEVSWLILFLIITPLVHLLASAIGYKLGVKREPY